MKSALCITALAVLVTGCASQDLVHFGGVLNPADQPTARIACEDAQPRLTVTHQPPLEFPSEVAMFLFANQGQNQRTVTLSYDINEDGETRNIRYSGDIEDLDHATHRRAVSSVARAINGWEYEWSDEPGPRYATMCEHAIRFRLGRWR